jgi:hypothetical protein
MPISAHPDFCLGQEYAILVTAQFAVDPTWRLRAGKKVSTWPTCAIFSGRLIALTE